MVGKRLLIGLVIILIGIGSFYAATYKPRQEQMHQRFDCGVLTSREELEHVFSLRNYSVSIWKIAGTKTSCGCTVVGSTGSEIGRLAKLDIPIRVNLRGKNGAFESIVTLNFEDGQAAEFVVHGEYYPGLPKQIELGRIRRGEKSKTFALPAGWNNTGDTTVKLGGSALDATIARVANGKLIAFSAKRNAPTGGFSSVGEIVGTSPELQLHFRAAGRIEADVEAESELVSVGYLERHMSANRTAKAKFYSPYGLTFDFNRTYTTLPKGFNIGSVTDDGSGYKVISLFVEEPTLTSGQLREEAQFAFSVAQQIIKVPIILYGYVLEPPEEDVPSIESSVHG